MTNDLIAWIDAQIEKNNSMFVDGEEEHPENSVYAQDNLILCKIKDALGEMSAVEYLEARKELCNSNKLRCKACAIYKTNLYDECTSPRRIVEIVKKWKEEQKEC